VSRKSGYVIRLDTPEDVRKLRQLMLDLDVSEHVLTFREISAEWLQTVASRFQDPGNARGHVERLNREIGHLTAKSLQPCDIERAIASMTDIGPATKNKALSVGSRVAAFAQKSKKWPAVNPFKLATRCKVPRPAYDTLSLEEARAVLRCVRPDRRDLFTVALVMGDRKGELFGLRKEDVDLAQRLAWIRRSHGRDTTKTGRPRRVPIPAAAFEAIRRAIEMSPSELVFPREDGGRFRKDTKLSRILKVAMGDAGVVLGYEAKCRRKGCGHKELLALKETKACPRCGFVLWLVPRTRRIRFHDLRHTAVTLHREAGADPLCIRLLVGHANASPTEEIYTHVSLAYQRRELDRLVL